jgi:hypothetical protein
VPLVDELLLLVQLGSQAADALQHRAPAAQPHGAAHVLGADLGHEHDSGVWRARVELGAVGVLDAEHVARKLDDSDLRTHTCARAVVRACVRVRARAVVRACVRACMCARVRSCVGKAQSGADGCVWARVRACV